MGSNPIPSSVSDYKLLDALEMLGNKYGVYGVIGSTIVYETIREGIVTPWTPNAS